MKIAIVKFSKIKQWGWRNVPLFKLRDLEEELAKASASRDRAWSTYKKKVDECRELSKAIQEVKKEVCNDIRTN